MSNETLEAMKKLYGPTHREWIEQYDAAIRSEQERRMGIRLAELPRDRAEEDAGDRAP